KNTVPVYKVVEISPQGHLIDRYTFDSSTVTVNATISISDEVVYFVTSTWENQLLSKYNPTTHSLEGQPQVIFTYPALDTVSMPPTPLPIIQDIWVTQTSHLNALR